MSNLLLPDAVLNSSAFITDVAEEQITVRTYSNVSNLFLFFKQRE